MPDLMSPAQPPLEFIPPALNPLVLRAAQQVLPGCIRSQTAITQIQAENVEILVDLYRQFQDGKIRFMMAFRHPRVEDPLCMSYLLWKLVPRLAREKGISLQHPIHAHFLYDRGIPLWAGAHMGWLYSRLGGTPIHRGKADWTGLRSARDLFANARFPITASPEGATNGHNEIISPLEPGIAQLGFWCAEDLQKAGRGEQVLILPVGIKYRYVEAPWKEIEKLLGELEVASGLPEGKLKGELKGELQGENLNPSANLQPFQASLYQRLCRLGEHLLSLMEEFYTRFYHQTLPTVEASPSNANEALAIRLQALLNVALQVAEEYFNLPSKGSVIDRCRRLEAAGWNYIYREDLKNIKALSPLERGLANRIAEEASLRIWHMRLVETFVAVTGQYVLEKPTVERFAETTLLLWDMVTRIKGSNPFQRPRLGRQRVEMSVGQPISVSERYPVYQANRHGARLAVADLTKDLQHAMEGLIASAG
ncbi:1-acyl-sn-glycerol-3-phosphate acyltransferase [Coleofasciculus sp. FACHB-1120]|uniref:1-acyl-sn-glycerol-3-phosphate acyltransferase n=1 Tax=Coleofasciculus sp. FACHB-1120 TaxID=2692783 RepID=UPI0016845C86|nr:1-acyl-sn-glycerol-3-phosphate acyltransferase [Coleofasciculus sp. FACHB-1120]MBD2741284.1 1-acyl-sn-glycerol-3-phosphate acyltransferase [Coleofasciculus sp. FACHB-1120]